ncbi:hypothetical protein [Aeromonas dhakensis]|uniref:hypothetical protein n=1 Tax=Aeromonas dhakensis TaxID=196024 RepID=UPI003986423F
MSRKSIPLAVQTQLLEKSRRRCALCFGINNDTREQIGQIAHLDQNNTNPALENLVWLCLHHHNAYDSSTSQSKNYIYNEIKMHRDNLYAFIENQRTSQLSNTDNIARKITADLNCLMQFIPYSDLRRYIEDFPYNFESGLDGVGDMWRIYVRDNPMVYPFSDHELNQRLDAFFDCQYRVEFLIGAHFEYDGHNGVKYRCNCFDANVNSGKYSLSSFLKIDDQRALEEEINQLKARYLNAYNQLTEYIRVNYPGVNLNQYRF